MTERDPGDPRGDTQPPAAPGGHPTPTPTPATDATLPASLVSLSDDIALATVDPAQYTARSPLTQGGMGRIVTARDRRLKRTVAIKELLEQHDDLKARFEREVHITARLQHPSIVTIYEAGRWPSGEPFYAMKFVAGRSLDRVIAATGRQEQRLALVPHVINVADAMAYAHQQRVIHRDLKPQNVLVGEFGETVVIDWGLAKDLADASVAAEPSAGPYRAAAATATVAGDVLGTPAYMPPEQAEGKPTDERADVYAIGAMLYHVLGGEPPYLGSDPGSIVKKVVAGPPPPLAARAVGIPPDLLAVVAKAMDRDPARRYPHAAALAQDLKRFQTGQLVAAQRYSTVYLLRRWMRRHRTTFAIAGLLVLLLGGFAAVAGWRLIRQLEAGIRDQAETQLGMALNLWLRNAERLGGETVGLASDPDLVAAIHEGPAAVADMLARHDADLPSSFVIVADARGTPLAQRAVGGNVARFASLDGSLDGSAAPLIQRGLAYERRIDLTRLGDLTVLDAVAPVTDEGFNLVGVVIVRVPVDADFLAGIKGSVGADVLFYSGTAGAVSSFVDRVGRHVTGIPLPFDATALGFDTVRHEVVEVDARSYTTAYLAIKDLNDDRVGILAVAIGRRSVRAAEVAAVRLVFGLAGASAIAIFLTVFALAAWRGARPGTQPTAGART